MLGLELIVNVASYCRRDRPSFSISVGVTHRAGQSSPIASPNASPIASEILADGDLAQVKPALTL